MVRTAEKTAHRAAERGGHALSVRGARIFASQQRNRWFQGEKYATPDCAVHGAGLVSRLSGFNK
jgi:hypothetical protein